MFRIQASTVHYAPWSCHGHAGEDTGWEDKEECGDGYRQTAAGFRKSKETTDEMFILRLLR